MRLLVGGGGDGLVTKSCPTLVTPCTVTWDQQGSSPWDFPSKDSGMGCHSLLQGIFSTLGLNPDLLHCRRILYHLSHQGSCCSYRTEASISLLSVSWGPLLVTAGHPHSLGLGLSPVFKANRGILNPSHVLKLTTLSLTCRLSLTGLLWLSHSHQIISLFYNQLICYLKKFNT